jgi:hypothetical protein
MHPPPPALTATLRALRGESDVHVVAPALGDFWLTRMLALAPSVHPIVGALSALAGALPKILPPHVLESPALSATVAPLIETEEGNCILMTWAEVAPAGWGAAHTDTLIDAVHRNRCEPWVAAALIGPCDASAALPSHAYDIAHAVRRWGQATPDNPTAWVDHLAETQRKRLLDALCADPDAAAFCLPWLPKASAVNIARRLTRWSFSFALDAYVAASPIARARHATVLSSLIQCTERYDLAALTRLAVAMGIADAWAAIRRILCANPWGAVDIVGAALWDVLPLDVHATILSAAQQNDGCAAIAFARGDRDVPPAITSETAGAFFAVVTPKVWTSLSPDERHAWCAPLLPSHAVLAVRSLGPDPTFLACAALNNDLIAAMRRHIPDDGDLRQMLLTVAVRDLYADDVPPVVAALPAPPDPVAFVQIAGCRQDLPPALRDWIVTHPAPHACRTAVTVLRAVQNRDPIARCTALMHALAGWSAAEADTLLAALPDDARAALHPDRSALADALAHPDRRTAFRQALDALDNLPSSVAIPALHALDALTQAMTPSEQQHAGTELARALRDRGGIFTNIAGALNDAARSAVLPRLNDPHVGSALDDLAAADPLVAHHLAYALRDDDAAVALDALAAASFARLTRIWYILPDAFQHAVLGDRNAILTAAAAPGRVDDLAQALRNWDADVPLPWLALRMLIDDDAERREQGMAILAQQPDRAAALLPLLRDDLCTALESVPAIAFACADLPLDRRRASVSARRRR